MLLRFISSSYRYTSKYLNKSVNIRYISSTNHLLKDKFDNASIFSDKFESILETIPTIESTSTITSFANAGLNNYTPPGFVQYIFESINVSFGVPWWGCYVCTMLIVRTILLPVFIETRRSNVALSNMTMKQSNLIFEILQAKDRNDPALMFAKMKELENIGNDSQLRSVISQFSISNVIQIFSFITMFMAMKGISDASISSFNEGGLAWFTNLTIPDPLYILPFISSASIFLMFFKEKSIRQNLSKSIQTMLCCGTVVIFGFLSYLPASMSLFYALNNVFSLLLTVILDQFNLKKYFGIVPPDNINLERNQYQMKDYIALCKSLEKIQVREYLENQRWSKDEYQNNLAIYKEVIKDLKERKKNE